MYCYNALHFFSLHSLVPLYAYSDLAKDSTQTDSVLTPRYSSLKTHDIKVDLYAGLNTIEQKTYSNSYDFHNDLRVLFNKLKDAHTRYMLPWSAITFIPVQFTMKLNSAGSPIVIVERVDGQFARIHRELYDSSLDLFALEGKHVVSIDGKSAGSTLEVNHGQTIFMQKTATGTCRFLHGNGFIKCLNYTRRKSAWYIVREWLLWAVEFLAKRSFQGGLRRIHAHARMHSHTCLYDNSAKDKSANDTSAKPTVRMPTVRKGQQCEWDKSANVKCANASSAMRHRCEKSATVRMTTVRKGHCAVTCMHCFTDKSLSSGSSKPLFSPYITPSQAIT